MVSLICKQVHALSVQLHFLLNLNLLSVIICSYTLGKMLILETCMHV